MTTRNSMARRRGSDNSGFTICGFMAHSAPSSAASTRAASTLQSGWRARRVANCSGECRAIRRPRAGVVLQSLPTRNGSGPDPHTPCGLNRCPPRSSGDLPHPRLHVEHCQGRRKRTHRYARRPLILVRFQNETISITEPQQNALHVQLLVSP